MPEEKFKLPFVCYDEVIKGVLHAGETEFPEQIEERLQVLEYRIDSLEKLDGAIERDTGERLWSLFNDPDISIGIHGTVAEADSNLGSEDTPLFYYWCRM